MHNPNRGVYPPMYNQRKYSTETETNLAYYVTVELELYPGTNPDFLQKQSHKCHGTFEKMREAFAELTGSQYRPIEISNRSPIASSIRSTTPKQKQTRFNKLRQYYNKTKTLKNKKK